MAKDQTFNIVVSAPLNHPVPYEDLVKNAAALGMSVDHARCAPDLKTFVGSVTEDVYERLKAVPGLHVSREQKMRFA